MSFVPVSNIQIANTEPESIDFLTPTKFQFILQRTPTTNYFIQMVDLPAVSLESINQPTPFVKQHFPGNTLDYGSLTLKFWVDEEMRNYTEILTWMIGLGHPESLEQYRNLLDSSANATQTGDDVSKAMSDGSLIILSSNHNPQIRISFQDMFPISLSPLNFDVTSTESTFLEAEVTFSFKMFAVERL